MRLLFIFSIILASLTTSYLAYAYTAGELETTDFSDVVALVNKVQSQNQAPKIILAFDIDNTLLSPDQDLGSEHWFLWQSDLISKGLPGAITTTVENLLTLQSWLYMLTKMHPTEAQI